MYHVTKIGQLQFSSYDVSKVGLIFNGRKLGLGFDDAGNVLKILTDGDEVVQIQVNVIQGSEAEDALSAQAGTNRLNVAVLQDANDAAGRLNITAFAVRVAFPYVIEFGSEAKVRTFVLYVDNSDDAEYELADDSFFQEQDADLAGFDGYGFYTVYEDDGELSDYLYT